MSEKPIVRTSSEDWLEKALKLYSQRNEFVLIDDAGLGLNEKDVRTALSLIKAAKKKQGMSWKKIAQILAGLGITGAGIWMIAAAIADPEPTSKLSLLIGGGIIITLTGSLGTFAALGVKFSISAKSPGGTEFTIKPEK